MMFTASYFSGVDLAGVCADASAFSLKEKIGFEIDTVRLAVTMDVKAR